MKVIKKYDNMTFTEDLAKCHISSGDGESVETAFVFDSDYTEDEAIALEYEALSALYGYEERDFVKQKLLMQDDRFYDVITFNTNGSPLTVYFDITRHFGK